MIRMSVPKPIYMTLILSVGLVPDHYPSRKAVQTAARFR
jgi:hypothetical protein